MNSRLDKLSLITPFVMFAACAGVSLANPTFFGYWVVGQETGIVEDLTVVFLIIAMIPGLRLILHPDIRSSRLLLTCAVMLFVGTVYFAGEEISWGQRIFGWHTPEDWAAINLQQETNLHNAFRSFGAWPKRILVIGIGSCLFIVPTLNFLQRHDYRFRESAAFLRPPPSILGTAMVLVVLRIPRMLLSQVEGFDKGINDPRWQPSGPIELPSWFDRLFVTGHGEQEELYIAMFIMIYLIALVRRLPQNRPVHAE